jgi:hypothetical protein
MGSGRNFLPAVSMATINQASSHRISSVNEIDCCVSLFEAPE